MKALLDDHKRSAICAILAVGGSRRMAAQFVGCSERTIRNTARRDSTFDEQLRKTAISPEITLLKNVLSAASDGKHWQAAKWALERIDPDRYAARRPRTLSLDQMQELIDQVVEAVSRAVPEPKYRRAIRRQIAKLTHRAKRNSSPLRHEKKSIFSVQQRRLEDRR